MMILHQCSLSTSFLSRSFEKEIEVAGIMMNAHERERVLWGLYKEITNQVY